MSEECQQRTHASQQCHLYSRTSSARASSVDGTSIPSALAVFILMTNSKRVSCSTGRSDGWAHFRILSTYEASFAKKFDISRGVGHQPPVFLIAALKPPVHDASEPARQRAFSAGWVER